MHFVKKSSKKWVYLSLISQAVSRRKMKTFIEQVMLLLLDGLLIGSQSRS